MNMSKNTIILIVLGLLLLGAAWYLLFGKSNTDSTVTAVQGPTTAVEQTFLNLTAQINPVAFDTRILDDPRFRALQDLKTAIVPETPGRTDPFAPLAGVQK